MSRIVYFMSFELSPGISHNFTVLHKYCTQTLMRCITIYLEILFQIWQTQDWCCHKSLLQLLKADFTTFIPSKLLVFLQQFSHGLIYFREILNEPSVVTC